MSMNRALLTTCAACLLFLLGGRKAWAISPDRLLDQYRSDVWVYKDGLPRSRVFTMAQTPDGYLWLGTGQGLMRFDGVRFARTAFDNQDPNSPSNAAQSGIYSLSVSPSGELWAGTDGHGFGAVRGGRYTRFATGPEDAQWSRNFACCWTRDGLLLAGGHHSTRVGVLYFVRQGRLVNEVVWPNGVLQGVVEDRAGDLWCAVNRVGLVQLDHNGRVKRTLGRREGLPALEFTCLCCDSAGDLWLGTVKDGLCRYRNGVLTTFHAPQELPVDDITCLCPTREGALWVGTSHGLARCYRDAWQIFRSVGGQEAAEIDGLCEDHEGSLWVSTRGGLIRYCDTKLIPVHKTGGVPSTPTCITIGPDGRCWAGTRDGGVVTPDPNGQISPLLGAGQGLPSNHLVSLCATPDGALWMSMGDKLVRSLQDVVTVFPIHTQLRFIRPDPQGDLVGLDRKHTLWRFRQGQAIAHYSIEGTGFAFCCQVDHTGRVWIGTDNGLYSFQDGRLYPVEGWPRGRNALCLAFSSDEKTLWVGTDLGLVRYSEGRIRLYGTEEGLPTNGSHLLALDRFGTLWQSTDGGVVSIRMQDLDAFDQGRIRTIPSQRYTQEDGFSDADVSDEAIRLPDGRLVFAYHTGFLYIDPANLPRNAVPPSVAIQEVKANGKSLSPMGTVGVSPGEGALEVHFAAMSFVAPEKVRFRYRLEGHDPAWKETATERAAYYTDLRPGTYTFRVIACNNDGVWNSRGQTLTVTLLPHFWQTLWFRLFCGLLALALLAVAYRWRLRQMVERTERLEAQNREMNLLNTELQRLNELKDEFLANTSHELRTPLNGMIGIAESMLDGSVGPLSAEQQVNMTLLSHSGKRLANLVNDILDFSRLRHRELHLHRKPVNLRALVEMTLQLDRVLLGNKELQLINEVPTTLPPVHADENRLQQILHNLVGNAIKFTAAGTVRVTAAIVEEQGKPEQSWVAVSIADTGIGIPEDKRERVFESFEQVEGSARRQYGGTGLGLAITKSLVELHGGQIQVESIVGEGSVLTFTLPVSTRELQEGTAPILESAAFARNSLPSPALPPGSLSESAEEIATGGVTPHVLVVDDEPVNLQVIKNFLRLERYHLTLASDGQEAMRLLESGLQPDILLLDVMMPKMTGYEVVQAIRKTMLADRLPIILLSARNQPEDIVMGLEVGANDYLTKPIGKEELVARIHTHLQIRQAIDARQKLESELAIAAQIQRAMVPPIDGESDSKGRYEIAGLFQPARMVGGDLYDLFLLGEDRLGLFIGDVADKGVPAALLMARTVTLIRLLARQSATAAEILGAVNHELCQNNEECQFVTLFCGILNLKSGRFDYAGAGHDAPLLVRDRTVKGLPLETGSAVGLDAEAVFPAQECLLQAGDVLALFTDGITEAMNSQGDLFTEERLTQALLDCPSADPAQVVFHLQEAHRRFVQEAPQSDDLTLLAMRYLMPPDEQNTPDVFARTLQSTVGEIEPIKQELAAFLEAHQLSEKAVEDSLLIVEEVLVNIIQHGCAGEPAHTITLRIDRTSELLRMIFEDMGRPFDPLTDLPAEEVAEEADLRVSGGYGFHLVRALTERMEYRRRDGRNILTLFLSPLSPPGRSA